MGKKGRKFINKNDPSCITFNLLHTDHRDPRNQQDVFASKQQHAQAYDPELTIAPEAVNAPAISVLKRVIPSNAARKAKAAAELPESLRNALDPQDFGIHANLSVAQMVELSEEVYGPAENFPESVKEKIVSASTLIKDEAQLAETKKELDLTYLENADCYFPCDGYNYEQHLRPINPDALYVPPELSKKKPSACSKGGYDISDGLAKPLTHEEKEVLAALENAEDYDPLSDDLVADVLEGADEDELLWGQRHSAKNEEFGFHRSEAEKREIDALLAQTRHLDLSSQDDEAYSDCDDAALLRVLEEEYNADDVGELEEDIPAGAKAINDFLPVLRNNVLPKRNKTTVKLKDSSGGTFEDTKATLRCDEFDLQHLTRVEHLDPLNVEERKRVLAIAEDLTSRIEVDDSSEEESVDEPQGQWDCESILTTRSNFYNHPGIIQRPSSEATRLPAQFVSSVLNASTVDRVAQATAKVSCGHNASAQNLEPIPEVCTESTDDEFDREVLQLPTIVTKRLKDETPEEKTARKRAVKEARKLIRRVKKENATLLKEQTKQRRQVTAAKNPHDIKDGIRRFRL